MNYHRNIELGEWVYVSLVLYPSKNIWVEITVSDWYGYSKPSPNVSHGCAEHTGVRN